METTRNNKQTPNQPLEPKRNGAPSFASWSTSFDPASLSSGR